MAVSPLDTTHFYVVSEAGNEILRYNNDGTFDKVFIKQGDQGLVDPTSLAFDSKGNLFVLTQGNSVLGSTVLEFNQNAVFVGQELAFANGPGTFGGLTVDTVTVTAGGTTTTTESIYLSDDINNEILRFSSVNGANFAAAPFGTNPGAVFVLPGGGGLNRPSGLSIIAGNLTVVSSSNGEVITYNLTTPTTTAVLINDAKNLVNPGHAVLGPDGEYYVTSPGLKEVARYKFVNNAWTFDAASSMPLVTNSAVVSTPTGLLVLGGKLLVGSLENNIVESYTFSPTFAAAAPATSFSPFTSESLNNPEDLAFLNDGHTLVVTNSGANDVLAYDTSLAVGSAGRTLIAPGSNGLSFPQGVTVGADGNIYVSNTTNNEVLEFSPSGAFISIFVRSGAGGLKDPQGLVFDPGVGLLVVSHDTGLVLLYNSSTGAFIREFTPEPLINPLGMTFDGTGNLYVASHDTDRVLQYDTTGNFIKKFTSDDLFAPQGAVLGPDGNLYVASRDTNQILRYYGPGAGSGLAGTFKDVYINVGVGGLIAPTGLVFGTDGNFYVSSSGSNEILRYVGASGAFINAFVKFVLSAGTDVVSPQGLVIDAAGNLYVASGNEVQEYRASSGAYIGAFVLRRAAAAWPRPRGSLSPTPTSTASRSSTSPASAPIGSSSTTGRPDGKFLRVYADTNTSSANNLSGPTGIAFDQNETLYVSSSKNSEVIRYQAGTGSFLDVIVTTNRGGLSTPEGIIISGSGSSNQLLVVSSDTGQVLSYSLARGTFNAPFTPGPLVAPTRVAFGPDGNFYVASEGTNSVLRLQRVHRPAPGRLRGLRIRRPGGPERARVHGGRQPARLVSRLGHDPAVQPVDRAAQRLVPARSSDRSDV